MRLSTLPTAFGEKLVMRIFDPETAVKSMDALGFGAHDGQRWRELIGAAARHHPGHRAHRQRQDDHAVCHAEGAGDRRGQRVHDRRPDRDDRAGLQPDAGAAALDMGFAEGLRALMRQDPDIIMVGEIRDLATAEMAIQAALTGHLVFSTLHTNDAAAAITRLADLGVPPYLISATVIGVLAQRLARTLCPACKPARRDHHRETLDEPGQPWRLSGGVRPYKPVGCLECRHTGYRGRVGLYELLVMSDAARGCVHPALDAPALRRQAVKDGMRRCAWPAR
jgi:general secretion pathway protein E